jgi:Pentatricopeptide repeat domain
MDVFTDTLFSTTCCENTQLLSRMEQTHRNNLNVCAYSTAVAVVGTSGKQWQQALALFNSIKQKGLIVDVVAYRSCIMMLQANNQWQPAVEVLQAMILDKVQPDVNSLNAVIDVCLKNQQWRVGLRLYEMVMSAITLRHNVLLYVYINCA